MHTVRRYGFETRVWVQLVRINSDEHDGLVAVAVADNGQCDIYSCSCGQSPRRYFTCSFEFRLVRNQCSRNEQPGHSENIQTIIEQQQSRSNGLSLAKFSLACVCVVPLSCANKHDRHDCPPPPLCLFLYSHLAVQRSIYGL